MGKVKKLAKGVVSGALVAFCLWIGISFFEINAGNAGNSPHYSRYNAFCMLTGYPDTM